MTVLHILGNNFKYLRLYLLYKIKLKRQAKLNKKQSSKVIIKDNQHNSQTQSSKTIKTQ